MGPRTLAEIVRRLPLSEVRTRLWVWVARNDPVVEPEIARQVWTFDRLVGVTVADHGGHSPQLDCPDELARWIDQTVIKVVPPGSWSTGTAATTAPDAA